MRIFIGSVVIFLAFWIGLYFYSSPPAGQPIDRLDRFILHEIALAYGLAALVMLFFRRAWTLRAVSLFWASVGTATAYGLAAYMSHGWPMDNGLREFLRDFGRASLAIGGPILIATLVYFVIIRDEELNGNQQIYTIDNHPKRRWYDRK